MNLNYQSHADNFDIEAQHDAIHAEHDAIHAEHDAIHAEHDAIHAEHDAIHAGHDDIHAEHNDIQAQQGDMQAEQEAFREEALQIDKADLLALLEIRFGTIPPEVRDQIQAMTDQGAVERLILVAANVPDYTSMLAELNAGTGSFRIVGDAFNPISTPTKGT